MQKEWKNDWLTDWFISFKKKNENMMRFFLKKKNMSKEQYVLSCLLFSPLSFCHGRLNTHDATHVWLFFKWIKRKSNANASRWYYVIVKSFVLIIKWHREREREKKKTSASDRFERINVSLNDRYDFATRFVRNVVYLRKGRQGEGRKRARDVKPVRKRGLFIRIPFLDAE